MISEARGLLQLCNTVLRCISKLELQLEVAMFGEPRGAQVGARAATDGSQSLSDTTRASLCARPTLFQNWTLEDRNKTQSNKRTSKLKLRVTVAVFSLYSSRPIHRDNGMLAGDNGKQLRYYKRP